ncbi:MAG TPA: tetratricopeptide repeat protein, partial [Allocoleopsis sp.]
MNNKFFNQNTTKLGLIALSIFGTFAVSVPVNFTVNPVLAQNNVSTNEAKKAQAEKLFNEGWQLYKEGSKESLEEAIIKFKQALILYQEINDKLLEASINLVLGRLNDLLGFKQEALNYYNRALPLYQQLKDRSGEATTLNNMGLVYDALGEKQKALESYEQALPLFKEVGNRSGEATTLNNIGGVYSDLGEKQQ